MDKVKFAIIGCGRIAQRHAEHINNIGKLLAVADIKAERAKSLADKYSCDLFLSIDELLNKDVDCDVVSVCTPNGLHEEHSIKALRAGKHVVCEKPMAISSNGCRNMIQVAEQTRKNLFVVKQNRFNPPIVALKNVIDENKLGKIFSVQLNCFWNRNDDYYINSDWKGKQKLDGGTLYTQFSHFIDLLYWMFGDINEVYAKTKNYNHHNTVEFEDTGVVIIEFKNSILGTINYTVNSYDKNMEGSVTIFGEKGTVKVGGQYINALEYQSINDYKITNIMESRPANDYGFYQGSMSNHDKVYENVLDVLTKDGVIATTGEEGLKTVEIIEKIYNSAKNLNNL